MKDIIPTKCGSPLKTSSGTLITLGHFLADDSKPVGSSPLFDFELGMPSVKTPSMSDADPERTPAPEERGSQSPPSDTPPEVRPAVPDPDLLGPNGDSAPSVDGESNPPHEGSGPSTGKSGASHTGIGEWGSKGYVYVPFYETAPKKISSNIDPANIIAGGR